MSKLKIGLAWDLDYLIYSAMSAAETETDWGDDIWTLECDHKKARGIFFGTLKQLRSEIANQLFSKYKLTEDRYEFVEIGVLSGDENWRKDWLATYKANRKGKRKPVGYPDFCAKIMEWFDGEGSSFKEPVLEGDDVLGLLMEEPSVAGCDRVIGVSCDKDFKTITDGYFFHITAMDLLKCTPEAGDEWWAYQTLKGDTADGYGGVPGVGEMVGSTPIFEWLKAPTFFYQDVKVMRSGPRKGEEVPFWTSTDEHDKTRWECMVSLAAKNGMSEEDLIVQAQVARIMRKGDYVWATQTLNVWAP